MYNNEKRNAYQGNCKTFKGKGRYFLTQNNLSYIAKKLIHLTSIFCAFICDILFPRRNDNAQKGNN